MSENWFSAILNVWFPLLWAFIFLQLLANVCILWWYSSVLYVLWCLDIHDLK